MNKSNPDKLDTVETSRRLTTILVADICGYSAMSEKDEASAIRLADLLYNIFCKEVERQGGRVFNRAADGFLAEFPSAKSCMDTAIKYCREVTARNNLAPNSINAQVRVGAHVGDVVDRDDGDILGHGVNIAARLQSNADPGTILISSNLLNLLGPKFTESIEKRGTIKLKNISEPIKAYQIHPHARSIFSRLKIRKKKAQQIFAGLAIILLTSFSYIQHQQGALDRILEKNNLIGAQLNDGGASDHISRDALSAAYMRSVLENLKNSGQPASQTAYAFLKQGDLSEAISYLNQQTDTYSEDIENPEHTEILLQIAALSYYNDPNKALAYYEIVLEIDSDNKTAAIWKFRTENLLGFPDDAQKTYARIITRKDIAEYDRLLFTIDYAFSFTAQHRFEKAIDVLRSIEQEIKAFGNPRLLAHWQTELAMAYVNIDNLVEAQGLASSSIRRIEKLGADTNLSRAYNLMGMIAEKKAELYPGKRDVFLAQAYANFRKEYEIADQINKITDTVEGLYSMARIDLARGNINNARANYLKSMTLARNSNHFILEIYSILGLAEVNKEANDQEAACNNITQLKSIYIKARGDIAKMKPRLANRVNAIGCS